MFCPNCGKPMSDEMAFCPECGTPRAAAPAAPQEPEQKPVQQPAEQAVEQAAPQAEQKTAPQAPQQPYQQAPQQPYQQAPQQPYQQAPQQPYQQAPQQPYQAPQQPYQAPQQPYQAPQQPYRQPYPQAPQGAANFYAQPAPPAPKKKKKGCLIALIIVLAIVAGIGALIAVNMKAIKNFFASTFSSPASYYRMVEKEETEAFALKASKVYATLAKNNAFVSDGKEELSAEITLSPDMTELMQSQSDVDMSWLKGMTVGVNFSEAGNNASGELTFKINNSEFLTGDFYLDSASDSLYARIDQLSSDYFRMDAENVGGLTSLFGVGELPSVGRAQLPDEKTVKELITRYVGILVDAIDEDAVDRDEGELTEGGVTEEGIWLTVELRDDDLVDVLRALLTEMRGDRDFFDLLQMMMDKEEMSWEDYASGIGELLDVLNEDEDITGGIGATMRVFVSKNGEIHGREIDFAGYRLVYSFPRNNGDFGYCLKTVTDGETMTIVSGSGKESGGALTGDFTLYDEGEAVSYVKAEKFSRDKLKNGEISGKFTFTSPDGASFESGLLSLLGNATVVADVDYKAAGGKAKLSFLAGSEEQIAVEINAKYASDAKVNVVSGGKEVEDYASGLDFEAVEATLRDRLKKAGAPEELVSSMFD